MNATPWSTQASPTTRRRRVTAGGYVALSVGAVISLAFVGGYLSQLGWINRPGTILTKSCHQSYGGDGSTFTACHLIVSYQTANGGTRTKTLDGVTLDKIHTFGNHETVDLYFSGAGSDIANNPQDRMPLFAVVVLIACSLGTAAMVAVILSKRRRA